ncbi:uncharacterized protein LOC136082431 [Hydra vulgaris]|uniref:Uncharacterized protein LOC136082431 n=1 Tax=Hydra vulgaris TaxID=6087 RepID=A0ABM4C842_HYDVU
MSEIFFKPCKSLWKEIQLYVSSTEKSTIKAIIGESLIEETEELHSEISILNDIWKEKYEIIPQSTSIQEGILKQIQFFVELLKKKIDNRECYWKCILNESDIQLLDEVIKGGNINCINDSLNLLSLTADKLVLKVNELLDEEKTEKLVHTFREHLEDERRFLIKQVQVIQNALIEKNNKLSQGGRYTSIADLRQLCAKLEKAVLSKDELIGCGKNSLVYLPKPPLQINNTMFLHRRNRLISAKKTSDK